MNVLVCTLGASWAVIPEIFGFVSPSRLDLYRDHPRGEAIRAARREHALNEPDEIWICTTEGAQTAKSLSALKRWWEILGTPLPLRIWTATGTDQLADQAECTRLRELILRLVLRATSRAGSAGQVILSLAGGRKTMSADLQLAGSVLGAHAWLHVVGPDPMPEELTRRVEPDLFLQPLSPELAGAVMPLVVGRGRRDELLDIEVDGRRVTAEAFPLPDADPECRWSLRPDAELLSDELDRRQREGSRLLGSFLVHLGERDRHENWRGLYRLPPAQIDELRNTRLSPADRSWIAALPKADLHRHLGGCLDLAAQRAVGQSVWSALPHAERAAAMSRVEPLLHASTVWPWNWPDTLCSGMRAANVAALLTTADDAQLMTNLYDITEPRIALRRSLRGFAAYERPGELTGSAILTHAASIEPFAAAVVARARAEGLDYVELRGSPQKYRPEDPVGFCEDLHAALIRAGAGSADNPIIRFIWILDRRTPDRMPAIIELAAQATDRLEHFLVGLDLAGDEGTNQPEQLARHFTPAFRECLSITIHAGEGEPAENIWQAAYHLHADRIGHGLTLGENPRLRERFRDRGICIELCPTSNREVVGFRDDALPETEGMPHYPLRSFMEAGLPISICTDNPGISRTTLADEYLSAARMSERGLTRWEALGLMRQGFVHAFVDADEKSRLMRRADDRVFRMLAGESR